jgi:tRNA modification GTPase
VARVLAGELPPPRLASLRSFCDVRGDRIDHGLALFFPAPASFTGEDVVELQAHGGPVVLAALLDAACAAGARPAKAGEFSERAFLNGRLDLAQVEAIADLIDAGSRDAAKAAQRSLAGELSRRVHAIGADLTELRTFVEGALDFSDEGIDWLSEERLEPKLSGLRAAVTSLLRDAGQGRRLRDGLVVAIAGQPNVGKSTLLNRLAGTEAAIVTDIAGTTRDIVREHIVVDGLPITIVDTAGLRDATDAVEREGVRRAWQALETVEVILFVIDDRVGVTSQDETLLERMPATAETIVVRNKCDLSRQSPGREAGTHVALRLSAQRGDGMELLISELKRAAGLVAGAEGLFSARARHVDALRRTLTHVQQAEALLREGAAAELAAEELRLAQQALGEITGEVTTEDLLGAIFSRFCIGK